MEAFVTPLAFVLVLTLTLCWRRWQGSCLPPGPPGYPFIGHLFTFSPARQDQLFHKWERAYGDIVHFKVLHQSLIVVNSEAVATELMEKRGPNYSNRPTCVSIEMAGYEYGLAFMSYNPTWRKHRKLLQDCLGSTVTQKYKPLQLRDAHALVQHLLKEPAGYRSSLEAFAMRTTVEVTYGHRIQTNEDLYVKLVDEAAKAIPDLTAGVSLVDVFPILRHIPTWLPGLSLLSERQRKWRPITRRMIETLFRDSYSNLKAGTSIPSFCTDQLQRVEGNDDGLMREEHKHIQGAASMILIGGIETTWSTLQVFVLCMVLYPEAQYRAHEEIDKVVGQDRVPCFDDREHMPYVECLFYEVLRWHPALPYGLPHRTVKDDIYDEKFIPAGAIVIPNIVAMSRDTRVYNNPEQFSPERYLPAPSGCDEPFFGPAFGFGRRICPGRHLAHNSVWIAIVTMLWAFKIGKATGQDGEPIEPLVEFGSGSQTSPPKPFLCDVVPRFDKVSELISQTDS